MSSHTHTTSGASSNVIPLPPPPVPVFELNQARRGKVVKELDTLRSGFLDWPTVEGLEAFAEKKIEYGEMMEDHVTDLQAVIREQRNIVDRLRRAAELAEERRLQEFQRDLERMDLVEVEVAQRAERERALLVQREYETRLSELNVKCARERARVRAKYQYDS